MLNITTTLKVIKSLTRKDGLDKGEIKLSKFVIPFTIDMIKQLNYKAAKQGMKFETFSLVRSS